MEFELKLDEFYLPEIEIYPGIHLNGTWIIGNGKFVISNFLYGYTEVVFAYRYEFQSQQFDLL